LHQEAGEAGADELGERAAQGELAVRLQDAIGPHEERQVGLIGDDEEDRHHAGKRGDPIELTHGQLPNVGRGGDRGEQGGAAEVGGDEDRAATQAIDPQAGGETEDEHRQPAEGVEEPHAHGAGVQHEERGERNALAG
jgi:hypothetical protein